MFDLVRRGFVVLVVFIFRLVVRSSHAPATLRVEPEGAGDGL